MYKSDEITIGDLTLGGDAPLRLQSMCNTDTLDVDASVAQAIRIIMAGGELVRFACQGESEANALRLIQTNLRKAGFSTPVIADIHFNPRIAELTAAFAEKVRINPGNYADRRATFSDDVLSDQQYTEELERVHERIRPLIEICHRNDTAVRIGVNHGSLSDRIMTRYGNSPNGMAVSAMEFIRIFRSENYHKLVLSMKSSNSLVMIEATKLLVKMMEEEKVAYPLHLGVTEAGEGEDGRIRSAMGIGALLNEGIGDTIRVSLSEDPEKEIPVARKIVQAAGVTLEGFVETQPDKSVLRLNYNFDNEEELMIRAAVDSSVTLINREANDIIISNKGSIPPERIKSIQDGILQAARIKITRNDYISCPTCGRTKFDLADAVAKVKKATSHLKGLKIAVMGCIVNGPGEMADADFGYIGSAEGKVNLYKGKELVKKNVPEEDAVEELLKLINALNS